MNKTQVELLKGVQEVLRLFASAAPSNPCDTAVLSAIGNTAPVACGRLSLAIFCIGTRDYKEARNLIDEARRQLVRQGELVQESRDRQDSLRTHKP